MTTMARLTPHQKSTLSRLTRLSGGEHKWVHVKDCGSAGGLEHLYHKGYADRKVEIGERGGTHLYYRVAVEGYVEARRLVPDAPMSTGEIDTLLIRARERSEIVRIFVGPKPAEIRGVPGEISRGDDGHLRLKIGQRNVMLKAISRVVA